MSDPGSSKDVSSERLAELIEDRQRFVSYLEAGGGDPDLDDALNMARDLVTALQKLQRAENEPSALRDALDAIASPSRPEDYGWWTQVARRALGIATARETAQPPNPDDVLEALQQVLLHADFDSEESHADFQAACEQARAVVRRVADSTPVAIVEDNPSCWDCPPVGYPTDATRCAECPRTTKCDVPKCLVTDCGQDATKDGSWCEKHYNGSHIWP